MLQDRKVTSVLKAGIRERVHDNPYDLYGKKKLSIRVGAQSRRHFAASSVRESDGRRQALSVASQREPKRFAHLLHSYIV